MNLKTTITGNNQCLESRLENYFKESVVNSIKDKKWASKGLMMLAPFAATISIADQVSAQTCNLSANSYLEIFSTFGPLGNTSTAPALNFDVDGDGLTDLKIQARRGQRGTNPNATSYYFLVNSIGPGGPNPFRVYGFPSFLPSGTKFYVSNLSYGYKLVYRNQYTSGGGALIGGIKRINTSTYPSSQWPTYFPYGSSNRLLYTGAFLNTNGTGTGNIGFLVGNSEGWINISLSSGGAQLNVEGFGLEEMATSPDLEVGVCPGVVPVEYVKFEVNNIDDAHVLSWKTTSEVNNQGFQIQRSLDGKEFENIGWVNGSGTSNDLTSYTFLDRTILPNIRYFYRLKQVDYDGDSELSDVVYGIWVNESSLSIEEIFPNPIIGENINVNIEIGIEENSEIILFDQSGKSILKQTTVLVPGRNEVTLNIGNIEAGSYILKVLTNHQSVYRKLVILE